MASRGLRPAHGRYGGLRPRLLHFRRSNLGGGSPSRAVRGERTECALHRPAVAPVDGGPSPWTSLEALLRTVDRTLPFRLPRGPLVVVGHSGAFRTILYWLHDPRVRHVILLDGLYRGKREFRYWLCSSAGARSHRLVLVADETSQESDRFARRIPGTARRSSIPEKLPYFTPGKSGPPCFTFALNTSMWTS